MQLMKLGVGWSPCHPRAGAYVKTTLSKRVEMSSYLDIRLTSIPDLVTLLTVSEAIILI